MGAITYSVSDIPSGVTLSKVSGIAPNEAVDITLSNDVTPGSTIQLTVSAVDETGESVSKVLSFPVNIAPNLNSLTVTQSKARYPVNSIGTLVISGGLDPDGDSFTYSLTNLPTGISFSKTTGIVNNESLTVTISDIVTPGADLNFTINATDSNNETTSVQKQLHINTAPAFSSFTGTFPARVVPGESYEVTIAGAADADNSTYTYSLSNISDGLIFSKTSGITESDTLTLTVSSGVTRNTTLSATVTVTDENGESASRILSTLVNSRPNASAVTCSLPSIVIPNHAYTPTVSGGTDVQDDALTYTITSSDATITNGTSISVNTEFNLTTPDTTAVARGDTFSITVTVSDGYETDSKTFTYQQNQLPDVTNVTLSGLGQYTAPESVHTCSVSGATDADNSQTLSYTITSATATISNGSNKAANAEFGLTVPNTTAVARGTTWSVTVSVSDGLESVDKVLTFNQNQLPVASSIALAGLPYLTIPGKQYTCSVSGATDADGHTIKYTVTSSKGSVANGSNLSENGQFTITAPSTGGVARGSDWTVEITASDGLESTNKTFTVTQNQLPDLSGIVSSFPEIMIPSSTHEGTITGITNAENSQTLTISITSADATITNGTNISVGDIFLITAPDTTKVARGNTWNYRVTASDGLETVYHDFTVTQNSLVDLSGLVSTIPTRVVPGQSYTAKVSGATNVQSSTQSLKYTITSEDATITGGSNINANTDFTVVAPDESSVARGSTWTYRVTVTDGLESVYKNFTVYQNNLPVITNMAVTQSVNRYLVNKSGTISFSGANDDADSDTVTYTITNIPSGITFSKTSGIAAGENVTITVGSGVTPGATLSFGLKAIDSLGEYRSKTFDLPINTAPNMSGVTLTQSTPRYPVSSSGTISISGATDADGDALTYSLSNIPSGITFSKTTGITAGESLTITIGNSVAAGSSPNITVTATDTNGESTSVTKQLYINTTPTLTFNGTFPSRVVPGQSYSVVISGGSDADAETLKYSLSGISTGLTFSKTSNIADGETLTMTVANNVTRGNTLSATLTVTDINNTSATAELSCQVNRLPVVTNLACSAPDIVKPNTTYNTWTVSGATDADGDTLKYTITSNKATITNGSGIAANKAFTCVTPNTSSVARGSTWTLTVTVSDGYETVSKDFTIKQNVLPNISNMAATQSKTKYPVGQSGTISFSGANDTADSGTVTYSVTNVATGLTFSKTSGIAANEAVTVTIGSSVTQGTTLAYTLVATDDLGESSSKAMSIPINNNPVLTNLVVTKSKNRYLVNSTGTIKFTGITDADSDTMTLSLSNISSGLTFSKTSGIALNEAINITVANTVSEGANLSATLTATDSNGGSTSTQISIPINTTPTFNSFTGDYPTRIVPGQAYTITMAGASDADSGSVLKYSITSSDTTNISFSSSSNIAAGGSTTMTVGTGVTRGSTITLTITVTDDNGATASKAVTTLVNTAPNITNLTCTLASIMKPGTAYTGQVSGATDAQSDTLKYTITSSKATITNGSNINASTNFNITTPSTSAVARGSTYTVTVAVTDGYETVTKDFTYKQNALPSGTITATLGASSINGHASTTVKFTGMTEPDSQTLKYYITSVPAGMTASATTNIAANTNVTLSSTTYVSSNTTKSFTVEARDALGEAAGSKTFSLTVVPVYQTSKPSITSPTSGAEIDNDGTATLTWSAYQTYALTD